MCRALCRLRPCHRRRWARGSLRTEASRCGGARVVDSTAYKPHQSGKAVRSKGSESKRLESSPTYVRRLAIPDQAQRAAATAEGPGRDPGSRRSPDREHLHASRVNYAHIDGDEFVIGRSYADGVPPFAGRGSVARFGKAIVDACRCGETVAVDDVSTDARFTDAGAAILRATLRRSSARH